LTQSCRCGRTSNERRRGASLLSGQLRQIRRAVSTATFQMLVVAVVHSQLDYGNAVLVGIPAYVVRRLQSVLNAAA